MFKQDTSGSNFPEDNSNREWVLNKVTLEINNGETLVLVGPSGCGKTTLLRMIAGLDKPDSGSILFDDNDISLLKPVERRIGMVFQNFALYPHLTAKENILTYFLFRKQTREIEKLKEETFKKTSEILGVEIQHLLDRKPPTLSGGERQRVAIGRCISRSPNIFLLDEPFTNLDSKIRESYRLKLKQLLKQLKTTTLYVTHDQHEAMLLGDKIAVMRSGEIVQTGTFDDVYDYPINMFVANFLSLTSGIDSISFFNAVLLNSNFKGMTAGVRSQDVEVDITNSDNESPFWGLITYVIHLPAKNQSLVIVDTKAGNISCEIVLNTSLKEGKRAVVSFKKIHLFDTNTELRLRTLTKNEL
jgi:multiple sugar transport system ATP-binding protein